MPAFGGLSQGSLRGCFGQEKGGEDLACAAATKIHPIPGFAWFPLRSASKLPLPPILPAPVGHPEMAVVRSHWPFVPVAPKHTMAMGGWHHEMGLMAVDFKIHFH